MVLRVEEILKDAGIEYRLIELDDRAVSVDDVIEYSKGDIIPEEICKTILVKVKKKFYALFIRGADKIDFKRVKSVIGKARIASLDEVKEIAGVEPGAVCPLLVPVPVLVDEHVMDLKKLNFGSGNHLYGVEITSSDLAKVLDFQLVDIV